MWKTYFWRRHLKRILNQKMDAYFELIFDREFMKDEMAKLLDLNIDTLRGMLQQERQAKSPDSEKIDNLSKEIAEAQTKQNLYHKTEELIPEMESYIFWLARKIWGKDSRQYKTLIGILK